MYTKDMKIGGLFLGFLGAAMVAVVSVHVFLDSDPEFLSLQSSDGALQISGTAYRAREITFTQKTVEDSLSPLSSVRYVISPVDARFTSPLVATLPLSPTHVLYEIDSQAGYAIALAPQEDADGLPYFLLDHAGEYAEGDALSFDAPTFVDVVSDMRARLPEHAVSYAVRVVARAKDGAAVLLPEFLEEGGCGGIPMQFQETVRAEDARTVQVLVNDVLTETTFTFIMDIGLASSGCTADMPLQTIF